MNRVERHRELPEMRFRMSMLKMLVDALLGSGVPVAGDPITSFENVMPLGLRTGTVVNNCKPKAGDIIKVRFLARNCGEKRIEIVPVCEAGRERDDEYSVQNAVPLPPGESVEYALFRTWDAPGEHQLSVGYEARCVGQPFARLAYPVVRIRVRAAEGVIKSGGRETLKRVSWTLGLFAPP